MEMVKNHKNHKRHKKKKRISLSTLILIIVLAAGSVLIAYPTASDWWNRAHAYQAITDYSAQVENMDSSEIDAIFEAAEEYNRKLSNGTDFSLTDEEMDEYMSLLNITGSGIIGYVQIPNINVELPVYHTVEEDVLQTAVGHIPGTSLPVGGERTHAAISGHRGLPSAKLFTDLNKMSEGDVFMITILDRTFTYQVDQIRIVLPQETEDLAIQPGRDYLTLVTCTPYGVNSHRMLVRGTRIANLAEDIVIKTEANKIPGYIMIPFIAAPILLLALAAMLVSGIVKGKAYSKERMLKELRTEGIESDGSGDDGDGPDAAGDGDDNNKKEDGTDEEQE